MTTENERETEVEEALNAVLPDNADPEVELLAAGDEEPEAPAAGKPVVPAATNKPPRVKQLTAAELAAKQKAARESAQKTLREAWNSKAKAAGFSSLDEMFEKVKADGSPDVKHVRIDSPAVKSELNQKDQIIAKQARRIKQLEQALDARDTELELRHIAYTNQVNADDIEYVTSQLGNAWAKLPAEKQKEFAPEKFLGELRTKKPHLFGGGVVNKVEEILPTTSPVSGTPRSPSPGTVKVEEAEVQKPRDARKMSRDEYHQELERRGFRNPAHMV